MCFQMLTAIRKERTIEWMTSEIYFKACDSEGSWFILMSKIQPLLIHIIDMCWPSTVISCFFYNHVCIVTGNSLNYFVKIHFILFEKHFTEREWERDRESEPSIYRFPLEMVPMTKAELIWTQNPGVSPGSSTWVKRSKDLSHALLLSQVVSRELDWKWSNSYVMMVLAGGGLAVYDTTSVPFKLVFIKNLYQGD